MLEFNNVLGAGEELILTQYAIFSESHLHQETKWAFATYVIYYSLS